MGQQCPSQEVVLSTCPALGGARNLPLLPPAQKALCLGVSGVSLKCRDLLFETGHASKREEKPILLPEALSRPHVPAGAYESPILVKGPWCCSNPAWSWGDMENEFPYKSPSPSLLDVTFGVVMGGGPGGRAANGLWFWLKREAS